MVTAPPPFPPPRRIVTGHDSTGKAIFLSDLPEEIAVSRGKISSLGPIFMSNSVPATGMSDETDIQEFREAPMRLVHPGGSNFIVFEMPPGADGAMHRTESLDYIIIVEGEVELSLDSGEKRRARRGDVVIQRGTMHAWKNVGEGWSRLLCVLLSAEPVKLEDGTVLGEDVTKLERKQRPDNE